MRFDGADSMGHSFFINHNYGADESRLVKVYGLLKNIAYAIFK